MAPRGRRADSEESGAYHELGVRGRYVFISPSLPLALRVKRDRDVYSFSMASSAAGEGGKVNNRLIDGF